MQSKVSALAVGNLLQSRSVVAGEDTIVQTNQVSTISELNT